MKRITIILAILAFTAGMVMALPRMVFAEDTADDAWEKASIQLLAARYAFVKGDVTKFRAMNWMEDHYTGGVSSLYFRRRLGKDGTLEFDGHLIPDEADYGVELSARKPGAVYVDFDYEAFRKWYDETGGLYYPFTTLQVNEIGQALRMDMRHFAMEVGPAGDDAPDIALVYERHEKEGTKSRLTWTAVKEGATTRNIGPSYQDLDEVTDAFALKGGMEVAGFDVKAEQRYERTHIDSTREERNLATTGVASDTKVRIQEQEPDSQLVTTTLNGSKWMLNDTTFLSMGYRYYQLDADELENIREYDANLNPRSFSNTKNRIDAFADNDYNAHTWTGAFVVRPTKVWDLSAKVKAEIVDRRGEATYPIDDDDPPNGLANTSEISTVESKIYRFGEKLSARFSGIPKTSLWAEADFEQSRNWLSEELVNASGEDVASSSGNFLRETIDNEHKTVLSLGGRWMPTRKLNLTSQYRHTLENNDYDDVQESSSGGSARSAFFNSLDLKGNEISSKVTYRFFKWLETSFRHQFLLTKYLPYFDDDAYGTESRLLSNTFTYDVFIQPVASVLLNFGFSRQDLKVSTPAANAASVPLPGFNADVNSWLAGATFVVDETLSLFNTFHFSQANNFNDFTADGLPLGGDFNIYDTTLGLNWQPNETWTISPKYSYYSYDTNTSADFGDYDAQVVWLDLTYNWF